MAKASVAGTTVYIPEGHPLPDMPGVRFVGPGAPPFFDVDAAVEAALRGEVLEEESLEGEEFEEESSSPYIDWPYQKLQSLAKARGLKASGTVQELVSRLEQFDEEE